jgi:hypothetical protein
VGADLVRAYPLLMSVIAVAIAAISGVVVAGIFAAENRRRVTA